VTEKVHRVAARPVLAIFPEAWSNLPPPAHPSG
jgi:hypothetical protein